MDLTLCAGRNRLPLAPFVDGPQLAAGKQLVLILLLRALCAESGPGWANFVAVLAAADEPRIYCK
jgi:hypothetical protein